MSDIQSSEKLMTTTEKKTAILEVAKSGAKRPNQKSVLGNGIANYTNRKNGSFDPSFTEELKAANPKWFRKEKTSSETLGV